MTTLERLWIAYCTAVIVVAVGAADGGEEAVRRTPFLLLHLAIAGLQFVPVGLAQRQANAARVARSVLAILGLPAVFSALCWLLPGVHPEPWQLAWYRLDLACWGGDGTAPLRASLPGGVAAGLQVVYASFYALPIVAVVLAGRTNGPCAFDRALTAVVGGFLLSYLGYLWFPTLGPKDVLPSTMAIGVPFAEALRLHIDAAEANPWDCFPSGHTMMSLVAALLVRRHAVRWFAPVLVVALAIAFSTLALRYHWPIDVVVGAGLALGWLPLCDRLLRQDDLPSCALPSGDLEALSVGRLDQRIVAK